MDAEIVDEGVGAPAAEAANQLLRTLAPAAGGLPPGTPRAEDGSETAWAVRSEDGLRLLAEVELHAMTAGGYVGARATVCVQDPPTAAAPRVVGDGRTIPEEEGFTYAGIAVDDASLAAQWSRFGLDGAPPPLDLERHVALFAGFGESSSCPFVYGALTIDVPGGAVRLLPAAAGPRDCFSDYNGWTLVIAVDRGRLPGEPFRFEVHREWSTLVVDPVAVPPEEPSGADAAGEVGLVVAPVPVDGTLTVGVENRRPTDPVTTFPRVRLDRWTGTHWEPARPPNLTAAGPRAPHGGRRRPGAAPARRPGTPGPGPGLVPRRSGRGQRPRMAPHRRAAPGAVRRARPVSHPLATREGRPARARRRGSVARAPSQQPPHWDEGRRTTLGIVHP